ncbi:M42 family metallopeptidase [Clostridium hydrogeniformans]|uniref:M42 family metallopeptidase n=1 Tax=Clostridium hydrogeniformans TaxID=349933 RepID=UPI000480B0A9|nr:M42 family metallopeptidase [Clostridium hydrogeniformans]
MKIDLLNVVENMKKYLDIESPVGYTKNAILAVKNDFEKLGLSTSFTKKGALIATLIGKNTKEELTICTHIDTLGAMVKEILPDGKIKFKKLGGGIYNSIEGANCNVITRKGKKIRGSIMPIKSSTHIYGKSISLVERNEDTMFIRLDERICSKNDVLELGINVGDIISIDTGFEVTESGFIKSRYIDNKCAVSMAVEICRYLKENKLTPKHTLNFIISNYEEIGHGISFIPEKTTELIAIDIAPVGEGQNSSEYSTTIAAKDKHTVYDYDFTNDLITIAEDFGIDYVIDVFNSYSSDASQAISRGLDMKVALVGPGVHGTHHYERTHISSIENTLKLLINYILKE